MLRKESHHLAQGAYLTSLKSTHMCSKYSHSSPLLFYIYMADVQLDTWYYDMPVVTRTYVTACCLTAAAITFRFVTPLSLYLNFAQVFARNEYWRLVTTFTFFEGFGLNFFFHMHFLYMYFCRLEEHYYRNRTVGFICMLLFGAILMLTAAYFLNIFFLSSPMLLYVLYVWCRRHPYEQLHVLGLFPVAAPYIPYVFLLLSLVMNQPIRDEFLGIIIGHVYWFLADIAPKLLRNKGIKIPDTVLNIFSIDSA